MAGRQVVVLKDAECNTNVLYTAFVQRNRHLLNIVPKHTISHNSDRSKTENASEIVLPAAVEIGSHLYLSNWTVTNSRYDFILGTPWHVSQKSNINYVNHSVSVDKEPLTLLFD